MANKITETKAKASYLLIRTSQYRLCIHLFTFLFCDNLSEKQNGSKFTVEFHVSSAACFDYATRKKTNQFGCHCSVRWLKSAVSVSSSSFFLNVTHALFTRCECLCFWFYENEKKNTDNHLCSIMDRQDILCIMQKDNNIFWFHLILFIAYFFFFAHSISCLFLFEMCRESNNRAQKL